MWNKLQIVAANAAGFKNGRCRYSALCIVYGPQGHPFVRAIKQLFVLWFKLIIPMYNNDDIFLISLDHAWSLIKIDVDPGSCDFDYILEYKEPSCQNSLHKVEGVVSQIIVFLYCLKWKPHKYNEWEDPDGHLWTICKDQLVPTPLSEIIQTIVKSYHNSKLAEVQKHYDGESITSPICWDKVTAINKSLRSKKKYTEAVILETIQAGAAWPIDKVAQLQLQEDNLCPLCGSLVTDKWHKYWTCPHLANCEHEAITASNHMLQWLTDENTALLNRAIVCDHQFIAPEGFTPLEEYTLFSEPINPTPINHNNIQQVPKSPKLTGLKGRVWDVSEFEGFESKVGPVLSHLFPKWLEGLQPTEEIDNGSSNARSSTDPAPQVQQDAADANAAPDKEEFNKPWPSGYYFGDGSGGPYSKFPTIRRAGVGVHYVSPDKVPTHNYWQPLPGDSQTLPRAELFAVLLVALHVEEAAVVDFFTDSKITKDTYYKGHKRAKFATNADLWVQLFNLIETKHVLLNIYWMPSHTDSQPHKKKLAPSWMQDWHVKGNNEADTLGNRGAEFHTIPLGKVQHIIDLVNNLVLIQNRLIYVTTLFPQRPHTKPVLPKQEITHKQRIFQCM